MVFGEKMVFGETMFFGEKMNFGENMVFGEKMGAKSSHKYLFSTILLFYFSTFLLFCFSIFIFKASALWADAFYKSICPSVCLSVCLSVCVSVCSLLRYRLTVFLPSLSEVGCQIFLEIQNPWAKVMERSGLRYEHFCLKIV